MNRETPQISLSREFDAPRSLVFRAFTDPGQLARWWGPKGNAVTAAEKDFDVRPGGSQRWTEISVSDPDIEVDVRIDLSDVSEGDLLEGVMRVSGRLQGGFEPFDTRFRIEFHDAPEMRTRLEIRQWLPEHLVSPSIQGWHEAFEKLDGLLSRLQADEHRVEA